MRGKTLVLLIIYALSLSASKPYIVNFSKENYSADNKNWSIAQDERGVMYFANDIGLLEFDGIEWELNYLPNRLVVRSVAVQSHNVIYTGSYEEFGRWDRDITGKLIYTSLSDKIDKALFNNDDFWKIWATDHGVYFQSFGSVFFYDFNETHRVDSDMVFLFLIQVRKEFLVQQMSGEIYKLHNNRLTLIEGSGIFRGTDVRVILPYGDNGYLFGSTTKGLFVYDGRRFREWNPGLSRLINTKDLNCGLYSSRGTYYLGTLVDGIYEVDRDGNILNHISSVNTLQNNSILSIYEDRFANLWVALDRGIACVQYLPGISCYIDASGNIGTVYDVRIWNGIYFIATNQGLFYVESTGINQSDALANARMVGGTQGQVWSLHIIDNKLLCCHNKGVKEIHKDLSVTEPFVTGTGVYNITEGQVKGKDVLLLATYNMLMVYDKETKKVQRYSQIAEPVTHALTDHLGNIWLEHMNRGVYKCQPGSSPEQFGGYTCYGGNTGDGLPYKLSMFKVGGRIVLSGNNTFYTYDDINDRIVNNAPLNECFRGIHNIRKIIPVKGDKFRALTARTVYDFVYNGHKAEITGSYNLGADMSLVNNYENLSVLNDSTHIICLDNGFLISHPGKEKQSAAAGLPAPCVESLGSINNKGHTIYLKPGGAPRIKHNYNTVGIRFSATGVFSRNLMFQYKLSHVDNEWSAPEKINTASYPRLATGKYTLAIRTVDSEGNHSEPVACEFEILSPWYQSPWAYLFYLLALAGTFFMIWLLVLRRYRNKHLQKIRMRETRRLQRLAGELQEKIKQKDAELLTQASFIIQKNELILKFKSVMDEYYSRNKNSASTAFYYKANRLLASNMNTEEDWKLFLVKFEEKHSGFFKKMKGLYPRLTSTDLRLCACLKLNLETKEIASLMNLSVKAVENNRYRLRKKLNLETTDNLNEFILKVE